MNERCTIYVDSNQSFDRLRKDIALIIGGKIEGLSYITTEKYELAFSKNDDSNGLAKEFPDDFLYFKYLIGIDVITNIDTDHFVKDINKILDWLWSNKIPTVASCDFEDFLLNQGGV